MQLASGALLRLEADGSFTHDPNDAFDDLSAGETAANSFRYTLSDDVETATASVTITIDGEGTTVTAETLSFGYVARRNLDREDDAVLFFEEAQALPGSSRLVDRNLYVIRGDGDAALEAGEIGHKIGNSGPLGLVLGLGSNRTSDDPVAVTPTSASRQRRSAT